MIAEEGTRGLHRVLNLQITNRYHSRRSPPSLLLYLSVSTRGQRANTPMRGVCHPRSRTTRFSSALRLLARLCWRRQKRLSVGRSGHFGEADRACGAEAAAAAATREG